MTKSLVISYFLFCLWNCDCNRNCSSLTEEKMSEILEALQVKHTDGNAGVSFKLPKSICGKYFEGMDSKQMAAVVEQALAA